MVTATGEPAGYRSPVAAEKIVRLSVNLSVEVDGLLRDYAGKHEMTKTEVVSLAIRQLVEREDAR